MGVKTLVYFEVVTTLALGIGLLAINITKAGVGLTLPAAASAVQTVAAPPPTHWDDFCYISFLRTSRRALPRDRFCRSQCSLCSSGSRWRR